jgi:hypothetical protein
MGRHGGGGLVGFKSYLNEAIEWSSDAVDDDFNCSGL